MRKSPTQCEQVIQYLHDFGCITRADALMDLGIANLPAVIEILRHKKGVPIITQEIESRNRYNQKCTYARYYIEESEDTVSGN